jgi:hypothetical protein
MADNLNRIPLNGTRRGLMPPKTGVERWEQNGDAPLRIPPLLYPVKRTHPERGGTIVPFVPLFPR